MNDLECILKITDSQSVELAESFKKLLHTELTFGMTRHVCRYGTLSDGHEKITEAQRYYQAIRESYQRAQNLRDYKVLALEAEADLIEANDKFTFLTSMMSKDQPELLRAKASYIKASAKLQNALVMAEDTARQLDEFLKVVNELQASVRAQYPEGIEQAEVDNWKAVAAYRAQIQEISGTTQHMQHLPLDMKTKAEMGVLLNKPELAAWLSTARDLSDKSPQGVLTAIKNEKRLNGRSQ